MPLDPVTQTLEQGRTQSGGDGSGAGGFVQMFLASRQLQQRRTEHNDEVNLAKQRLSLEDRQQTDRDQSQTNDNLLAPLIRDHQSAVNKQVGATAQGAVLDTQLKADRMEGLNALTDLQIDSLKAPGGPLNPDILDRMRDIFKRYGLMRTPEGSKYMRSVMDAQTVDKFTDKFGAPQMGTVTDAESGASLQFGTRNPQRVTSELGKLYQDRKTAIADGDFDAADMFDQRMATIAEQSGDKKYAPSDMAKKMKEYKQALIDGDASTITYYEDKLHLNLSDTERALYRSGLAAINNDPTKVKAEDKQKAQKKFTDDFLAEHGRKASTIGAPEVPKSTGAILPVAPADTKPALPRISNTGAPSTPSAFQKGERRSQNGHTFQFDGSKWNVVE